MSNIIEPDMFAEPENLYQPEPSPTFISYERSRTFENEPSELTLRLVGKSPLWGHLLWNAGRVTAEYVEQHRDQLVGKTVLELGAAAALPSLLAALVAKNTVATDYPDPELIDNIVNNIGLLKKSVNRELSISAQGYIWGNDIEPLLNAPGQNGQKYDFIILSDLVFNHTEHKKLINTCKAALAPNGEIFVAFTPHRPRLFEKDLAFFTLAEELGFTSEKIIEKRMQPMFEEEEETREIRSMVFAYILRHKN